MPIRVRALRVLEQSLRGVHFPVYRLSVCRNVLYVLVTRVFSVCASWIRVFVPVSSCATSWKLLRETRTVTLSAEHLLSGGASLS